MYKIGIAGPSGSGKTEIARRLGVVMPGEVRVLSVDCYYRDLAHLSGADRDRFNFDEPDALDWELLVAHLQALSAGDAVSVPVYRFDTHTRGESVERLHPPDYLIVEGLLALHEPALRAQLDLKIFVQTPDEVCFDRRLRRDIQERGRTHESVHRQYRETVRPCAERYILPTMATADLILCGTDPVDDSVTAVLKIVHVAESV